MRDDIVTQNLELARLADHVTGELTPEDAEATRQWIEGYTDHTAVVSDLEKARAAVQLLPGQSAKSSATERIVRGVLARIQPVPQPVIANDDDRSAAAHPRVGTSSALLSVRRAWYTSRFGIGAVIACLFIIVFVGRPFLNERGVADTQTNASANETTPEFIVRPGELITLTLADGSRVTLAPGSRLRYGSRFGQQDRTVHLTGRGFFEVAPNARLPFIVHAAHSAVQVLGTSFVVSAYPSDTSVKVVVRDGKVALRAGTIPNATGVALIAGDLGELSPVGLVTVTRQVNVSEYIAWTQGRLEFTETPASTVARELELRYNIRVRIDPSLASIPVTAAFDEKSADEALERFASGLNAAVVRNTHQYRITPSTSTWRK